MRHLRNILILLLLSTCSSRGSDNFYSFQISEENSITIVETTGGPKFNQPLFTYEEIITLTDDPSDPESILFRPGEYTIDHRGFFYLVDSGNARIAVFDSKGKYLDQIGKEGEGPGEFQRINLLRLDNDILTVFDNSLQRTTLFSTDGALLDMYKTPGTSSRVSWVERMSDGGVIRELYPEFSNEPEDPLYDYTARRIVITTATGDTSCDIESPWIPWGFEVRLEAGNGAHRMEFTGNSQLLYYPSQGILSSTGVDPVLTWYDFHGNPFKIIKLAIPPQRVTAAERENVFETLQENFARYGDRRGPPGMVEATLKAFRIPDRKAFWEDVKSDDAGYYWLQIPEPLQDVNDARGTLCMVLSPEGEYLGNTRWPSRSGNVCQSLFLGYYENELTGERIPTIYRILPAVDGLKYP